ncbi:MAG: GNAT family N-acetyltransferase [Patescibacteria group bacterium]
MVKVEIAKEKDLRSYRELRSLAITGADKELFGSSLEMIDSENSRSEKEWIEDIVSLDKFVVLAQQDYKAIGMASVIQKGEGWYLRSFFVKEDFRNNGAGKTICATGLNEIRRRGGKRVFLHVRNGNDIPNHIFESFGFKKTQDDSTGVGYFMELAL